VRKLVSLSHQGKAIPLSQGDREIDRKGILGWLSSNNQEAIQSRLLNQRHEGTGKWFLDTEEFQIWAAHDATAHRSKRILYCPGIPGAGKSYMLSIGIEKLRRQARSEDAAGVAFYYFKWGEKSSLERILESILRQLLQERQSSATFTKLYEAYEYHKARDTWITRTEILVLLNMAIKEFPKVFIAIDALDECQFPHEELMALLGVLFALVTNHNFNFIATSRDKPEIGNIFENSSKLGIQADVDDLKRARLL
jgi:hypothetical protein